MKLVAHSNWSMGVQYNTIEWALQKIMNQQVAQIYRKATHRLLWESLFFSLLCHLYLAVCLSFRAKRRKFQSCVEWNCTRLFSAKHFIPELRDELASWRAVPLKATMSEFVPRPRKKSRTAVKLVRPNLWQVKYFPKYCESLKAISLLGDTQFVVACVSLSLCAALWHTHTQREGKKLASLLVLPVV